MQMIPVLCRVETERVVQILPLSKIPKHLLPWPFLGLPVAQVEAVVAIIEILKEGLKSVLLLISARSAVVFIISWLVLSLRVSKLRHLSVRIVIRV